MICSISTPLANHSQVKATMTRGIPTTAKSPRRCRKRRPRPSRSAKMSRSGVQDHATQTFALMHVYDVGSSSWLLAENMMLPNRTTQCIPATAKLIPVVISTCMYRYIMHRLPCIGSHASAPVSSPPCHMPSLSLNDRRSGGGVRDSKV